MFKKFLMVGALLLVLMAGFAMVPAKIAHADSWTCAPGNPGPACDHQDPQATGCAGQYATTLISTSQTWTSNGHQFIEQMRYSTACQSRWTRLKENDGSSGHCLSAVGGTPDIQIYVPQRNNLYDTVQGNTICDGAYTNMLYDPTTGVDDKQAASFAWAPDSFGTLIVYYG